MVIKLHWQVTDYKLVRNLAKMFPNREWQTQNDKNKN